MNRMSTSYCLFGNTTCPFKYPNKKKEWWLQSCYAPECKPTAMCMLLLLPKLPTRNKDKPFSPLKLNSSLHTKTVQQLLTSGQQTKAAASNLRRICRQEIERGNFANTSQCPSLNFPLTRELIWVWALPITSKRALCSDEYFGAMGQGKSRASNFMLGL